MSQEEPQGGEVPERRARAVHAALQLRKLRDGGLQALPVPLPLTTRLLTLLLLPTTRIPTGKNPLRDD